MVILLTPTTPTLYRVGVMGVETKMGGEKIAMARKTYSRYKYNFCRGCKHADRYKIKRDIWKALRRRR